MKIPRGIRADRGHSYRSLERVAELLRDCLCLESHVPVPGMDLFEKLDEFTVNSRKGKELQLYGGCSDLGPDEEALAAYNESRQRIEILLSEETLDDLAAESGRSRLSLCHELSHAVLHTDILIRLATLPKKSQIALHRDKVPNHPFYLDTEWQAYSLAVALLAPANGLRALERKISLLTPQEVAGRFLLSLEAAEYRVENFLRRREELLSL